MVDAPRAEKKASAAVPGTRIFRPLMSATLLMGLVEMMLRGAAAQLQHRILMPEASSIWSHQEANRSEAFSFYRASLSGTA